MYGHTLRGGIDKTLKGTDGAVAAPIRTPRRDADQLAGKGNGGERGRSTGPSQLPGGKHPPHDMTWHTIASDPIPLQPQRKEGRTLVIVLFILRLHFQFIRAKILESSSFLPVRLIVIIKTHPSAFESVGREKKSIGSGAFILDS